SSASKTVTCCQTPSFFSFPTMAPPQWGLTQTPALTGHYEGYPKIRIKPSLPIFFQLKMTNFEGGIRGTGVIFSPLFERTGYVSTVLIHVSDWLPTFYAAAGTTNFYIIL